MEATDFAGGDSFCDHGQAGIHELHTDTYLERMDSNE